MTAASRPAGDREATLASVALLYYGEGLTQGEIARRMRLSRTTVVNMLRECRDLGIVDIRVNGRRLAGSSLSRELREMYGLEDVYIAQTGTGDRAASLPILARAAATALLDLAGPDERIGVAWGETIMAVADAMPRRPVAGAQVCQIIGSMISQRVPASESCAIQIAKRIEADCYTLHAPGIMSSPELAERMRKEPTIRAQLKRLRSLTLTVASIGNTQADTHLAAAGMATRAELAAARKAGAVGVYCCRYIDREGREVNMPPRGRIIAAELEDLRAAKKRLLAVCGSDRGKATMAALAGGYATHLCVDRDLARMLADA